MKQFVLKYKWPLLAAAVAVLVRWIYLLELSAAPGFDVPIVDEKWHWLWAQEILDKSFWGEGAWFRAPLYPYFLAFLAFITGKSIFFAKLLQLLVCGGTAFFVTRLGEHLYDYRVGLTAGLIYAVYGTLLYYEAMFLIPVVFLFFVVWGMYRLIAYQESEHFVTWLSTGIVFGLAAISRPNILLVMPLLMLWLFFSYGSNLMQRLKKPLLLLLGLGIVIAPVTVRNIVVTGEFVLISSQGGVNLYLGNNRIANGLTMVMPEVELSEDLSWRQFQPATHAAAEREAGRELTESEASSFWTGRAIEFITENPGEFLGLVWKKSVYLVSGFENSDNLDIYYERNKSVVFSLLMWDGPIDFPFGLLLPLALMGIWLYRSDTRKLLPIYLYLIGYVPTIVLFLVTARHRLPLVPFLAILAAAGAIKAAGLIRQRRYRPLIPAGIILAGSMLVFSGTYYDEGGQNQFQIHFNEGIKQENLGNLAKAEEEYLAANRQFNQSPSLLTNLGHVQYQLGKSHQAEQHYRRALAIEPGFFRALNNLGLVIEDKGLTDSALILYQKAVANFDLEVHRREELAQLLVNLARMYDATGQGNRSAPLYDSAMTLAPEWPEAVLSAAAFHARRSEFAISDSLFRKGLRMTELSATDFFNWGLSFIQRDDLTQAVFQLKRSVKQDSTLVPANYLLAASYARMGMPRDSVTKYIDRVLSLNPRHEPTLRLKEQMGH